MNKHLKDKDDFIDLSKIKFRKKVSRSELWLIDRIVSEVVSKLSFDGGDVKLTQQNINVITNALTEIFNEFDKKLNLGLINLLVKDFSEISRFNRLYFKEQSLGFDFGEIKKETNAIMRKSIGLTKTGKISKGSFLDSVSNTSNIKSKLQEQLIRSVTGGSERSNIIKELKNTLTTTDKKLGLVNSHYYRELQDQQVKYDRAESKVYADKLKMDAFIYSGTRVGDTRDFCAQRIGKIFTREEAKEWSSKKWQGKNKGYSPLIDLGGYNCLHSPQWITNRTAAKRRDDLDLDSEGNLIKKSEKAKV